MNEGKGIFFKAEVKGNSYNLFQNLNVEVKVLMLGWD